MAAGEKCGPLRLDDGRRVDQRIKPDPFNGRLRLCLDKEAILLSKSGRHFTRLGRICFLEQKDSPAEWI